MFAIFNPPFSNYTGGPLNGGRPIAHIILSFGFGNDKVAISIEIRKEQGESYSALAGFFRNYELFYVVADESDLIGLRTNYRKPAEDVFLYRVNLPKENLRKLFLQYTAKVNELHAKAEFYNTLTTNCTTNIVMHVRAFQENLPLSWKMLLSGYLPELIYERGKLDQSLSYQTLRQKSHINARAKATNGLTDFSERIRKGLPGF